MFARLSAKCWFMATAAIALVFFGIGLIGLAIATLLTPHFGAASGYAMAGAILLLPPLIWACIVCISRPRRREPPPGQDLINPFSPPLPVKRRPGRRWWAKRPGRRRQPVPQPQQDQK